MISYLILFIFCWQFSDAFRTIRSYPFNRWHKWQLCMASDPILIGVAADSGCGKSTFMRRLTQVIGGKNPGPLGGGFGSPNGWETNTLVSDLATVICLDDYHLNDRQGRKKSGLTALHVKEQNFELMARQISDLKEGKSINKPIYNHVNGTIDSPEVINPTPIVIIEGLHPFYDKRIRSLLDFTIFLDISDSLKRSWKIHRDTTERGWTVDQTLIDMQKRLPDFESYVAPQKNHADLVLHVAESELGRDVSLYFKNRQGIAPSFVLNEDCSVEVNIPGEKLKKKTQKNLKLSSYNKKHFDHHMSVLRLQGHVSTLKDFEMIESMISQTSTKYSGEITQQLENVGEDAPGSLDGTGLFQTLIALKIREYYESVKKN